MRRREGDAGEREVKHVGRILSSSSLERMLTLESDQESEDKQEKEFMHMR